MKRTTSFVGSMAIAIAMFMTTAAAAQTTVSSTDADLSYDKAVASVWGQLNSTRYVVDWCANNNRGTKSAIKKAYGQWSTRFAPLITDINQRMDAVMNPGGKIPAKDFEQKKADLLKRGAQRFADGKAAGDVAQARRDCEDLPGQFETRAFDLEALFMEELRLIRARPAGAH